MNNKNCFLFELPENASWTQKLLFAIFIESRATRTTFEKFNVKLDTLNTYLGRIAERMRYK